jgi:hypothetical protein
MSKKSDQHEYMIASHINDMAGVTAFRPTLGTQYSDIKVTFKNVSSWLEVKMNHQDNLANPRVYYKDKTWNSRYSTPVAGFIVQELNKSQVSRDFVYSISDYCGMAYESIYIPTNIGEMGADNAVPRELMRQYCKMNGAYVLDYKDYDISELVTSHYVHGKAEPAYYMQAGDDFFMISNTNPLGLSSDIPQLKGTGKLRVRVSNRSKFYEIQAELKMTSAITSNFSVLPGTNKCNPFLPLQC